MRNILHHINSEQGNLIIELALVVGILAFTAMGGLELAHYLQRSQVGVSLTRELANNIARDCYDVCSIERTLDCAATEVDNMQEIASQLDDSMRVRARIWQRNVSPQTESPPCVMISGWSDFVIAGDNGGFISPRSTFVPEAIQDVEHPSGIQIIAEVEATYTSLTGYVLRLFRRNSVYYHGTLI